MLVALAACAENPPKPDAPPPPTTAMVAPTTTASAATTASATTPADVTADERAAAAKELADAIITYPPLLATPPPTVAPIIDKAAAPLLRHPTLVAEVGGHASDDELEEVAWARANLIASSLAARGVSRERLVLKTYGKGHPRVQGTTEEARAKNRRVEIKLVDRDR